MAGKRISSLSVVLGATVKPFVSAFAGVKSTLTSFTSSIGSVGGALLKLTGVGAIVGGAFAALKGAASGITLAADLEQVGVAFETMLGTADKAKALMGDLTQFSAATPFELPEIASSAKKLLAFGVGAGDMTKKLTMLGDIAAGVGAPLEDIAAIYGKIKSRGQLTGETLNQMAERGIPIYSALAKSLGVAESQIADMVSAGEIGFGQVDKALAGLTASGGQFSGMMAKQSQTLAGLWSTLTDTIGLALADLVTTIVDAFGIRDGLKALTAGLGSIGSTLSAAVKTYAPIVVAWAKQTWAVITSTFSRIYAAVAPVVIRVAQIVANVFRSLYGAVAPVVIGIYQTVTAWFRAAYDYLAPIVQTIRDVIVKHWQATLVSTTGFLVAIYGAIKSVLTGAWSVVSALWGGIVGVWQWATGLLGMETNTAAENVGGAFDRIARFVNWFRDQFTLALNGASWAVANWRDIVEFALLKVAYGIVKTGNQIEYVFGTVIPGWLMWVANNWRDILTTIADFTASVFVNMGKNVGNFFLAVWSFLKGDGFNFEWTSLTEGFETSIKQMPQIAEREIGALEQALGNQADALGKRLGDGLGDYLAEQDRKSKAIAKGITDAFTPKIETPKIEAPELPEMPKPAAQEIPQPDTSALDTVTKKAKDARDALDQLVSGSAKSQLATYLAGLQFSTPRAGGSSSTAGAGSVPMPVQKSMQESTTPLLKQLVELAKQRNSRLDEIADSQEDAATFAVATL